MNVDTATLRRIQRWRVLHDDIPPYDGVTPRWLDGRRDELVQARYDVLQETPKGERVPTAPWIELGVFHDRSLSREAFTTPPIFQTYLYISKQLLDSFGLDVGSLFDQMAIAVPGNMLERQTEVDDALEGVGEDAPSNHDIGKDRTTSMNTVGHGMIGKRHRLIAEDIRRLFKLERDHHFIEERWDDIPFDTSGVPKVFWRKPIAKVDENEERKELLDVMGASLTVAGSRNEDVSAEGDVSSGGNQSTQDNAETEKQQFGLADF